MGVSRHYSQTPLTEVESRLEGLYIFREIVEVRDFLEKNPVLVEVLIKLSSTIKEYFPQSELFLEVITDPEATSESHLTLFISTSLDMDEALDKYEQFLDNCWLNLVKTLPQEMRGKLNTNLEFQ